MMLTILNRFKVWVMVGRGGGGLHGMAQFCMGAQELRAKKNYIFCEQLPEPVEAKLLLICPLCVFLKCSVSPN